MLEISLILPRLLETSFDVLLCCAYIHFNEDGEFSFCFKDPLSLKSVSIERIWVFSVLTSVDGQHAEVKPARNLGTGEHQSHVHSVVTLIPLNTSP